MPHNSDKLLLLAAAAAERREAAAAFLERHAAAEPLVLAPTRGAADDLLRDAVVAAGGEGFFGVARATLAQAAAEIAAPALARRGLSPVSGLALEALAARAVDLCRGQLTWLGPIEDTPGLPRALLRTLGELRGAAVDAELLRAGGAAGPDLARLLGCFAGQLEEAGLIDPPALFRLAAEIAAESRLGGRPLLALDLTSATAAEEELLRALVEASPAVLAVAPLGEEEAEAAWTRLIEGAPERRLAAGGSRLDRLRRHLFDESPFSSTVPPDSNPAAAARSCFDRHPAQRAGQGRGPVPSPPSPDPDGDWAPALPGALRGVTVGQPFLDKVDHRSGAFAERTSDSNDDDSFELFAAPGEGREAVEIARRVLAIGRAGGAFDRVAVALREPDLYWPLLEEAFGRAGIPAFFSAGSRRPDPAGRAFLALLACAAESLSASRFAEYLSLGQVPPLDDAGELPEVAEVPWVEPRGDQLVLASPLPEVAAPAPAPRVSGKTLRTPRRWERWLVDAAVIAGADRWRRRLAGIAKELELQLADADDGDAVERERLLEDLADLGGLRRFALPVIEMLAALPKNARWGAWLTALETLAARVLAAPERVLATLAELRPMAEIGPVGLEEVRRVLEERLTLLRTPPLERRWGKVFVCRVGELRGRAFDHLFLPGLADGLFPRKVAEDPLLLDERRAALAAAGGPALPQARELLRRERALLRLAVQAAGERLVASYPSLDALAGRARVPSFYALDLLRAAEGSLPDLRSLEKRAAEASLSLLGWPAPRRPEAAIDDAEFDLGVLAELLREPPERRRGAARFLLETSAPLRRSLRNRFSRWTSRNIGASDGLVAPAGPEGDGTRANLADYRLDRRPYSPTALEQFAACPLRFAYRAIFGLRPRDRIERLEQLDPATRGALFHRVQFLLQGELAAAGLLPLSPATLAAAEERLDRVLSAAAADAAENLAPAIPRVFAAAIEKMRLDLRGWLQALAAAADGYAPLHRELSFGLPPDPSGGHDPASVPDSVSPDLPELPFAIHLRGAIDLVELRGTHSESAKGFDKSSIGQNRPTVIPAPRAGEAGIQSRSESGEGDWGLGPGLRRGDDRESRAFSVTTVDPKSIRSSSVLARGSQGGESLELRVTDHKTGRPPEKRYLQVGGGEKLQPILYALVAEKLLGRKVGAGRLFFCTRRGGYKVLEVRLDPAARKAMAEVLGTLENAIEDAFLPAWPRPDACATCDFLAICGPHEEKRIRRKKGDRLRPLEQVRSRS